MGILKKQKTPKLPKPDKTPEDNFPVTLYLIEQNKYVRKAVSENIWGLTDIKTAFYQGTQGTFLAKGEKCKDDPDLPAANAKVEVTYQDGTGQIGLLGDGWVFLTPKYVHRHGRGRGDTGDKQGVAAAHPPPPPLAPAETSGNELLREVNTTLKAEEEPLPVAQIPGDNPDLPEGEDASVAVADAPQPPIVEPEVADESPAAAPAPEADNLMGDMIFKIGSMRFNRSKIRTPKTLYADRYNPEYRMAARNKHFENQADKYKNGMIWVSVTLSICTVIVAFVGLGGS